MSAQPKKLVGTERLAEISQEVDVALDNLEQGEATPEIVAEALALIQPPSANALQLEEFSNNRLRLNVSSNISLPLLNHHTKFWSSFAGKGLSKFDQIRVVREDETCYGDFIVVDVDDRFVDCELIVYRKISKRLHSPSETAWLHDGDTISVKSATGTLRGGYVITRKDGVEILSNGVPFKTIEDARRFYIDAAWNRSDSFTKYLPG